MGEGADRLSRAAAEVAAGRIDPYSVADRLVSEVLTGSVERG
jgi:hypothetical protein